MSEEPGDTEFGVSQQGVEDFAASFGGTNPAELLAPVWRAMLQAGVIVAPDRVTVDRAEVVLIDPHTLELRVPVSTVYGELVQTATVYIHGWFPTGELAAEMALTAKRLASALETADANSAFIYDPGPGQKPHN